MEPENIDVSSHLIAASKETATIEADRPWLNGDAIAIIIAGRFVHLLCLLTHPRYQQN